MKAAVRVSGLFFVLLLLLNLLGSPAGFAQCGSICGSYTPAAWPGSWIPYRFSTGAYIQDGADESPSSTEIIFDNTLSPASVSTAFDGTNCFFRIQLTGSPSGPKGFDQFLWQVMIYSQAGVHLATVGVDGNPSGTGNDVIYVVDPAGGNRVNVYTMNGIGNANLVGAQILPVPSTTYSYLDFQIPICVITYVSCAYGQTLTPVSMGITASSPVYLKYGTSTTTQSINKDVAGCSGTNCALAVTSLSLADFNSVQNGALPVELSSFTGQLRGDAVQLRWTTATESNCYGFDVERSAGDGRWETRAFIAGHGTVNTPCQYSFTDRREAGASGTVQYRLRCIDRDGTSRYSHLLSLRAAPEGGTYLDAVYPSPIMGGGAAPAFSFALDHEAAVSLCLYSPLGQRLPLHAETILPAGYHTMTGREAQVATTGTWFVVLTVDGAKQYIRPFVVLQ